MDTQFDIRDGKHLIRFDARNCWYTRDVLGMIYKDPHDDIHKYIRIGAFGLTWWWWNVDKLPTDIELTYLSTIEYGDLYEVLYANTVFEARIYQAYFPDTNAQILIVISNYTLADKQ